MGFWEDVAALTRILERGWGEWRVAPGELVDCGDGRVLVAGGLERPPGDEAPRRVAFAALASLTDAGLQRLTVLADPSAALAAAGPAARRAHRLATAIRHSYAVMSAGDVDAFVAMLHPDLEWKTTFEGIEPHGREEARTHIVDLFSSFGRWSTRADEVIVSGDRALASVVHHGRGKESGAEVTLREAQLIDHRDGMAIRVREYATVTEALEAAAE